MRAVLTSRIPVPPVGARRCADVVIVGSGVAGMVAALSAAEAGLEVELVTKTAVGCGSSVWAQGGVAAAVDPADSPAEHAADTIAAGGGLCDPWVVHELTAAAPRAVRQLEDWGVCFDRVGGHLALAREGGHGRSRILHAGGDATGAELVRALTARLAASVTVTERCAALDLLTAPDGSARGISVAELDRHHRLRSVAEIEAGAVVLATGGLGQAFATTSNPVEATGDGLALAVRAGALLRDVEFVQFHPTVLWQPGAIGQRPLLTEALRGAGAVIRDRRGRSVMSGVHPLADLAPRDVVAGAMARCLRATGEPCLWLDLGAVADLASRFPTVVAACRAAGIDPEQELLPVRPAAHYACGGVRADLDGRTSVPQLFAVGEVAATGAHGANRLASNGLLEAVIAGIRAARLLVAGPREGARDQPRPLAAGWLALGSAESPFAVDPASRQSTCEATERYAGVLREGAELERLIDLLSEVPVLGGPARDLAEIEATNLHTVSTLIAVAALTRQESRGCHQRSDDPSTIEQLARPVSLRIREGLLEAQAPTAPLALETAGHQTA